MKFEFVTNILFEREIVMNNIEVRRVAQKYLEDAYGEGASFRDGQIEAISAVLQGQRALVVQKTGWGKSLIYFLSTKILRDRGKGLTIVISPLLALMNNQLDSAERFQLVSRTINSNNAEDWEAITDEIAQGQVDILFISPERLAKKEFNEKVIEKISGSIGMLVVDEAHCISDWGHDFRPDYRRIANIIKFMPYNVPLLATTATANDRVVEDVADQLGENILIQRGPLIRESLALQVIKLDRKEERLAWLSENIRKFDGSGIIYCLTKSDCNLVSAWLRCCGIDAQAYYSGVEGDRRELESMFIKNEMKVLVATSAFGMGIDKPDISFVIHFQKPGNVVAYYQQIGRAGRGVEPAYAILLAGSEDDEITEYFIKTAFPTFREMDEVIKIIEGSEGLSINGLMSGLDMSYKRIEHCLKVLSINGDVYKEGPKYHKAVKAWEPDMEYANQITRIREHELNRMNDFIDTKECYMKFLAKELNDEYALDCGKCTNCLEKEIFPSEAKMEDILGALDFIKGEHYAFDPRKQWPSGERIEGKNKIYEDLRCERGIALSNYGDAGWGRMVRKNKYDDGRFSDELVEASKELLAERIFENEITWVTSVSSKRRPELVRNFAEKLASALELPYHECIAKTHDAKQQKELNNSHKQFENAWNSFDVGQVMPGNVLLVDDMVDSKWTFTVCGYKMRENGSGKVYPFALANTAGSGGSD